jgi:hypothetical protein
MVGLIIFGQADMMTAHATNFVTWELDGAYLVSNYLLLIVSASLEAMLLLWSRNRKP